PIPLYPLFPYTTLFRSCFRTSRVACIRKHECPGHGSLFQSGRALLRPALLVFGNKMDGIARDGSLKLEGTVTGNSIHFVAKDEQGGTEECTATLKEGTMSGTFVFTDAGDPTRPETRSEERRVGKKGI